MPRRVFAVCLILALLGMALPAPGRAQSPFETADCPDSFTAELNAECGYFTTPERPNTPDKTIALYYAVIKSTAADPSPYPTIYLAGGPGGNGVDYADWMALLLQHGDLILYDQRGTGYTQPSLNCPEMENAPDDRMTAMQACYDRLKGEGIDLSAYNTTISAGDMEALRVALGYEKWIPYGISYGTRLGLEYLRQYPTSVYSLIIDGVYPPNVQGYDDQPANAINAFKALFAACAADSTCNTAHPDLEKTFYTLIETLDANPVTFTPLDGANEQELTGKGLIDTLFQTMYNTEAIPSLPKAISLIKAGDYPEGFALLSGGGEGENRPKQENEEDVSDSEGMNLSVECVEEIPFNTVQAAKDKVSGQPPVLANPLIDDVTNNLADCEVWQVERGPASFREPVKSDTPVLVLSGTFDPITPPVWGKAGAVALSKHYRYDIPHGGHGVIGTAECVNTIISSFLANPASQPDDACLATFKPLPFVK